MSWEFLTEKAEKALVFAVVTESEGNAVPIRIHPRGLDPEKRYFCAELNRVCSGQTWIQAGILVDPTPSQYESKRFLLQVVK